MSESIISIGSSAFYGCNSLEKIEIPDNVTMIGDSVFYGCNNLEEIEIPMNVTAISHSTFAYCSNLKKIKISKGVTTIGYESFFECSSLGEIEIPDNVTMIGDSAFLGCNGLSIFGKKDSYAETYAKANNIPFIAINEITSSDNISVIYSVDSVQGTISLQTKKLTKEDEEYKNIELEDKIVDSSILAEDVVFTAYDISIVDENNNKVQPSQNVTVKIPCSEGYDGKKCKVYRVNNDGTFTDMIAEYEDEYMVFKTNHFNVYLITETEFQVREEVIKGDTNGDGKVDIKDSALIKRYLAGSNVELDLVVADVNGDGEVTIKDSALIKRKLAGWE